MPFVFSKLPIIGHIIGHHVAFQKSYINQKFQGQDVVWCWNFKFALLVHQGLNYVNMGITSVYLLYFLKEPYRLGLKKKMLCIVFNVKHSLSFCAFQLLMSCRLSITVNVCLFCWLFYIEIYYTFVIGSCIVSKKYSNIISFMKFIF